MHQSEHSPLPYPWIRTGTCWTAHNLYTWLRGHTIRSTASEQFLFLGTTRPSFDRPHHVQILHWNVDFRAFHCSGCSKLVSVGTRIVTCTSPAAALPHNAVRVTNLLQRSCFIMADVAYIVEQLNAAPFNMKLVTHKFSDLKGLDLLQKVRF